MDRDAFEPSLRQSTAWDISVSRAYRDRNARLTIDPVHTAPTRSRAVRGTLHCLTTAVDPDPTCADISFARRSPNISGDVSAYLGGRPLTASRRSSDQRRYRAINLHVLASGNDVHRNPSVLATDSDVSRRARRLIRRRLRREWQDPDRSSAQAPLAPLAQTKMILKA